MVLCAATQPNPVRGGWHEHPGSQTPSCFLGLVRSASAWHPHSVNARKGNCLTRGSGCSLPHSGLSLQPDSSGTSIVYSPLALRMPSLSNRMALNINRSILHGCDLRASPRWGPLLRPLDHRWFWRYADIPLFLLLNCHELSHNLFHLFAISRLWMFANTSAGLIFQDFNHTK